MPNNLLVELKDRVKLLKKLSDKYGDQTSDSYDADSYKFLMLCLQKANFAIRECDYDKIKASLEALTSFRD